MRLNGFHKQACLFWIGAVLAVCGIGLALGRTGPVIRFLTPLPLVYAGGVAGFCFWARARNAAGRERMFWRLWSCGCWLSAVAGTFVFLSLAGSTWLKVQPFGLAFTFLPQVLFMASLVMQPETTEGQLRDPAVRYEALLVALWWVYLYALIISPWRWVLPNPHEYRLSFVRLHDIQNVSLVLWLGALWLVAKNPWRRAYGHLTGGFVLLAVSTGPFYRSWSGHRWLPAMGFQALMAAAFLWLAQSTRVSTASPSPTQESVPKASPSLGTGAWLASITAIGIPLLAFWASLFSEAPAQVQRFRILVSFAMLVTATLLLYRWQDVTESQRDRLVHDLEMSVKGLRHLQGQFAEAEKLASLGQLAAGAAHEINNPLAAILGYSELLRSDPSAPPRAHDFGRKIGEQTRRIRNLVQNLLSLAEPGTREMETVDVSAPLRGALELGSISAGHRKQNLSLVATEDDLRVHGDRERLLQVFYRLLLALSEEDGDTSVEVRLRGDSDGGRVIVEFIGKPRSASTWPAAPEIYSAQRVQQGKELSLGVCYAVIQEHGGCIVHETRMDGGKCFRVELPAAHAIQPAHSAFPH